MKNASHLVNIDLKQVIVDTSDGNKILSKMNIE